MKLIIGPAEPARLGMLLLPLLLVAPPPSRAQDEPQKYALKEERHQTGDVYFTEQVMVMEMDVEAKPAGAEQALPVFTMTNRSRESFTDTVLKSDVEGPSLLRRAYHVAREQEKGVPGNPDKVTTFARQGKTLTFRRANGKVSVVPVKGKLPPAEAKKLRESWGQGDGVRFFPKEPVALGEEWTVEGGGGDGLPPGLDKMVAKAKLEEIVAYQGRSCARIKVSLEMSGTAGDLPMTITSEGTVYHDLERQTTLSVRVSGPATISGKVSQGGEEIEMTGTGTFTMNETVKWQKLAGKPVTAAKPPK